MNRITIKPLTLLAAAAVLALFACASPGPMGVEQTSVVQTSDSVVVVDTFTATVTVSAIDTPKRKITFIDTEGHKSTYKAGPEVVNFDQIRVGDQVRVVLSEEVAMYIGHGEAPSSGGMTGVALAPVGAKPGGVMVDTMQVTAKVTNVDAKSRKVTFEFPDGSTKKVKADKKVDLSAINPGDNVTVQVSEGLAIMVQKP